MPYNETYFSRSGDGRDFRIDVCCVRKFLNHKVTAVMQQRLSMYSILHLSHFL